MKSKDKTILAIIVILAAVVIWIGPNYMSLAYVPSGMYTVWSTDNSGNMLGWSFVCLEETSVLMTTTYEYGWNMKSCPSGWEMVGTDECSVYDCGVCPGGYSVYTCHAPTIIEPEAPSIMRLPDLSGAGSFDEAVSQLGSWLSQVFDKIKSGW